MPSTISFPEKRRLEAGAVRLVCAVLLYDPETFSQAIGLILSIALCGRRFVIKIEPVQDHLFCRFSSVESLFSVKFTLQDGPERLCCGIVPTHAALAHRAEHPIVGKTLSKLSAVVLRTLVAMEYHSASRRGGLAGFFQSRCNQRRFHGCPHRSA